MLGQGGTVWRSADALPPDAQRWQRIAVDPVVAAARVAGLSHGFLIFDDTGSEWTRQGERFTLHPFPNRFVHSREAGAANAPYLTVVLGPADKDPPAAPGDVRAEPGDLPAGEAWVSWVTPADAGPAGTAGFFVSVNGTDVPRYLIPAATVAGQRVRMHLRDLGLQPDARVTLAVRAVDGAGNIGPAAQLVFAASGRKARSLPGAAPTLPRDGGELPRVGGAEIAVLDELDKVQPVTGEMIPRQQAGYLAANHLWIAKEKKLRLHAARNEFVAFQILVRGSVRDLRPQLTFARGAGAIQAEFGRYVHVASKKGPLPDPIVPLADGLTVPGPDEKIAGQQSGSLLCEVYVPHDAPGGDQQGELVLRSGDDVLRLAVSLHIWDFTLPDRLSFLPEMNCYGLPANERDYYRLAHRHRTILNRLPYFHSGAVAAGCAWLGRQQARLERLGPSFRALPGRLRLCRFAAQGGAAGVLLSAAARELAHADGGQLQRRLLG